MHDEDLIPGVVDPWAHGEDAENTSIETFGTLPVHRYTEVIGTKKPRLVIQDADSPGTARTFMYGARSGRPYGKHIKNLEVEIKPPAPWAEFEAARHGTLIFTSATTNVIEEYLAKSAAGLQAQGLAVGGMSRPNVVLEEGIAYGRERRDADALSSGRPAEWRIAAASAIAGGAAAVGVVLAVFTALGDGVEVNPYIAGSLALGGIVLLATLIVALRDR